MTGFTCGPIATHQNSALDEYSTPPVVFQLAIMKRLLYFILLFEYRRSYGIEGGE